VLLDEYKIISGYLPVEGSCEHGNEPSVSIKGSEFVDWQPLKDSGPWN
jgi:hypothetical protein